MWLTIDEKVERIREIPKKIVDLEITRDIKESVGAMRYDNIGAGKGSKRNSAEDALISAISIEEEISLMREERDALILEVCDEIDAKICDDTIKAIDMRVILKEHILRDKSLKQIARDIVHREYKTTRRLYQEGCEKLKYPAQSHSIPHDPT